MSLRDELSKIDGERFEAAFAAVVTRADHADGVEADHEIRAMNIATTEVAPALQVFTDRMLSGAVIELPTMSAAERASVGIGVTATILALVEYAGTEELDALLNRTSVEP